MMFDQWMDGRDESLTACLVLERAEDDSVQEAEASMVCPKDGSIYRRGLDTLAVAGRCNSCQTSLAMGGSGLVERVRSWYQTRGNASRRVAEYFRAQGLLYRVDGTESPEAVLGGLSQLVADR